MTRKRRRRADSLKCQVRGKKPGGTVGITASTLAPRSAYVLVSGGDSGGASGLKIVGSASANSQHRTQWSSRGWKRGGASCLQRSIANGHLAAKLHPGTRFAYGDAFLAAVATGRVDPGTRWDRIQTVITPDPAAADRYARLFQLYREAYPATAPISHAVAATQESDRRIRR